MLKLVIVYLVKRFTGVVGNAFHIYYSNHLFLTKLLFNNTFVKKVFFVKGVFVKKIRRI